MGKLIYFLSVIKIALIGLLVIAIGIFVYFTTRGEYRDIEVLVTGKTISPGSEDPAWDYTISYTVDGKTYEDVMFPNLPGNPEIGETVIIQYLVGNPTTLQTKGGEIVPFVFMGVGAVVTVFGIWKALKMTA